MTSVGADAVDLVCGPDGPLPEGRQRYRLTGRLGSGGQADVFRGVRLSNNIRSAPVTVKVFRADHRRPVLDQMRSWDKGDAVLMDLNTRDVSGICLRVDGFYGAPPVRPDATSVLGADTDRRIPYQVLDYLPGHTLLQHVAKQASGETVPRLNGATVLTGLARTIALLHHPAERGESAVLHMDVKPANVLVLPSGEIRLIDFTAARYHDPQHITTIAHTPESAGPEAFTGVVGPSYDVHGFGAVAYHLVTGWLPRADRATSHYDGALVAPGALRRHPLLDANPALAAHLLAPLDDNPANRPLSSELVGWVTTLARLAAGVPSASMHVDWVAAGVPLDRTRVATPTRVERIPPAAPVARASVSAAKGTAQVGAAAAAVSSGPPAPPSPAGAKRPAVPNPTAPLPEYRVGGENWAGGDNRAGGENAPQSGPPASSGPKIRSGVAKVGPRQSRPDEGDDRYGYPPQAPSAPPQQQGRDPYGGHGPQGGAQAPAQSGPLRRQGKRYTTFAVVIAAASWLLWLATVAIISGADTGEPLTALGLVVAGAFGVWWLVRLGGHLIRSTLDRGSRRSTLVQNLATGTFILLCATVFLTRATGNFSDVGEMISQWWSDLWDSIWPF
ncbi:protein kinase domain-containing protein [Cryptosporangium aurantiacum]|uniref:Serine/threonine protein kinase n=1 Tax=Cryptosporangium aurantiacum TaxID=134849 RepID=A0A1M7Q9E0_9ACTN|nr:hypothetical protein [Cryptosporangium aurantiacum]SHN26920.1 Serine/threonine protein kinase [Cryptosporangium aurantiacum]